MKKLIKGTDFVGVSIVYYCHDGKGNFIMGLRNKNCRDEHGKWDIGGGGLEFNDTVLKTLKKEIREEYCTTVIEYEFLGYRDFFRKHNNKRTHWIGLDFKVRVDPTKVKNGEPKKFDDIKWFRLNKLPKNTHSQFPTFFSKYEKRLQHDHSVLELVDIVDENGNVLYTTTKKEAHTKGLLHKTVIGGVIDKNGNITLVKQESHKQDAGQYVSPVGGHVGAGESDDDALKRETREEIGHNKIMYKLIGKKIFKRKTLGRDENHLFIYYEIYSDKPLLLSDEAVEYRKFTRAEIKTLSKTQPYQFGEAFHFILKSFYPSLI